MLDFICHRDVFHITCYMLSDTNYLVCSKLCFMLHVNCCMYYITYSSYMLVKLVKKRNHVVRITLVYAQKQHICKALKMWIHDPEQYLPHHLICILWQECVKYFGPYVNYPFTLQDTVKSHILSMHNSHLQQPQFSILTKQN